MTLRAELKQASLQRILDAAAARLRAEGLSGAAIAPVMGDAGLTHGAFYAHFASKEDLAAAALRHALKDNRRRWTTPRDGEKWRARLARLAARYLTPAHRDDPAHGCAFAATASEAGRGSMAFRQAFEAEMMKSLRAICGQDPDENVSVDQARFDAAAALLALCVGGMTLARAAADPQTADRILAACRAAAERLGDDTDEG